ncbi:GtrA family protein [Haloferax prahovense]|uniref:GtrA family protein n=1 Tax=Haloferax prahovense TaxID=381852 RepID=UPI0009DFF052|nr:GtrA family protein [Haloferax prahovense]
MATEPKLKALIHRARIGQFISVGVVGATIETTIVALLTGIFGISPLMAKAVGAETSISTMFVVNDRWTFADEGDGGMVAFARRWTKSHLVRVVGLSVAFSVLYLLTTVVDFSFLVGGIELWPTIANIVGIGVGMTINYVAESLFTWNVTEIIGDA